MVPLHPSIEAELIAYRDCRCPPSPFVAAVLTRGWRAIKRSATPEEKDQIPAMRAWLYDSVSYVAFGSRRAGLAWLTPPNRIETTLLAMGAAAMRSAA